MADTAHSDTLSPHHTPSGTVNSHGTRSPSPALSYTSATSSSIPSGTYSVTLRERTIHTPATTLGPATAYSSLSSKRSVTHEDYHVDNETSPKRAKTFHESDEVAIDSDMSIAPFERSCIRDLRRDSNINTLLQLYDEHGHIDSGSFESPEKAGRPQTKRSGSTLRNLLGVPESGEGHNATWEHDISWAERILG